VLVYSQATAADLLVFLAGNGLEKLNNKKFETGDLKTSQDCKMLKTF
jgi:hypothetical protein